MDPRLGLPSLRHHSLHFINTSVRFSMDNIERRTVKIEKNCLACGKLFPVRRDRIERSKTCSRKCLYIFLGENNKRTWSVLHKKWASQAKIEYVDEMKYRFEKFFTKSEGCWIWNGSKRGRGRLPYGCFTFRGKTITAHRASYFIYKEDIPDGKIIMHKCDNARCVNPSHLKVGTHLENEHDKLQKGRHKGEKLTPDKVKDIRSMLDSGYKGIIIQKKYDISGVTLHSIKIGKTWSWVK